MKRLVLAFLVLAKAAWAQDTVWLETPKFLGTWYELGRFDEFFERGCAGVTSQYSMLNEKELRVVNRCLKGGLKGKLSSVEGKAWAENPKEPGKLKLQFQWPFSADYWVLEVSADYSWALMGNPKKSSCWVLSRSPTVSEELWNELLKRLKARGYDTTKLLKVEQAPASVETSPDGGLK